MPGYRSRSYLCHYKYYNHKLKMSDKGRLRRGKKWYDKRDINGKLPDDISKDPGKMCDVNFYLASLKKTEPVKKEEKPVSKKSKRY